ncbi:unnamed protein product, partial [Meganyctiphanes norvegica]
MTSTSDFDGIIERLYSKPQARVVIMFVDEDNTRRLLAAAIKAGKAGHFLWVGSDSWGAKIHPVRDQEEAATGAITILPQRTGLTGFDNYLRSLRPKVRGTPCMAGIEQGLERNCRNVWFKEFWTNHFNCTFREKLPPGRMRCEIEDWSIKHEQEGLVPFVVDAVYALAHALHNLIEDKCGFPELCDAVLPAPSGAEMLQYIRNVSFIGRQGREVKFNQDGDAPGSYSIFQYQKIREDAYDYVHIGNWTESLQLDKTRLVFSSHVGNETLWPTSICSTACPPGSIRNFQDACCWSCVPCPEDSYINNDTCVPCELGWAPDKEWHGCYKLTPEHLTWSDPWAIVPVVFSALGLVWTLFTLAVFVRYNTTPVIMASGRELCYVLLTGIALCYLMTFIILAPPTIFTCVLLRIGLGFCLSISYSAIFTKTNRI